MELVPCLVSADTRELIQDAFRRDPEGFRELAVTSPYGARRGYRRHSQWRSYLPRRWRQHHQRCGGLPQACLTQIAANLCLMAILTSFRQSFARAVFEQWLARGIATEAVFVLATLSTCRQSDLAVPLARVVHPFISVHLRMRFYKFMAIQWGQALWRCWWWFCGMRVFCEATFPRNSPVLWCLIAIRLLLWPAMAVALHFLRRQSQEESLRGAAASILLRTPPRSGQDLEGGHCSAASTKSKWPEMIGLFGQLAGLWAIVWRPAGAFAGRAGAGQL
mmetsp:Transcript_568/g.1368  ORF Transcript_568/g.1368 Transcript_568/m.1368 type:complete len:277 (-) Transcript_568:228-1058(-)